MPPANSPEETPSAATAATSPYLQQLEAISSPVPNLAATLTTQLEDDANHENVSFLRTRLSQTSPDNGLSSGGRSRQPYLTEEEFERFETERDDRMRRTVDLNRRIRAAAAPYSSRNPPVQLPPENGVFENRIPRQQSLYDDWPPGSDEEDEEAEDPPSYTDPRQHLSGSSRDPVPESSHAPWNRMPQMSSDRSSQAAGAFANQYNESSLATAALLQSVRRHPQFSRRTRNTLSNYILDNHDLGQQPRRGDSEAERQRARFPRPIHPSRATDRTMYPDRYHPTEDRSSGPQSPSTQRHNDNRLREVLWYLERVRFCMSHEEKLSAVALSGFSRSDLIGQNVEDFLLDTASLAPPRETSWLKNGCVFSGSQQAAHSSLLHHREWTSGTRMLQNPNYSLIPSSRYHETSITVSTTGGRRYLARTPSASSPQTPSSGSSSTFDAFTPGKWPVRVTLHTIDYRDMTLSGTMEARSIPDKSSPTQESSITTFLEGEIIDFNKHTLETKSFKSDTDIDATYWSRLMPFREMSPETMYKSLLSRKWISETLQGKWVLMRWKERCVLEPSHPRSGSGLTISGFYYISLNREKGLIEGLYYDPGSSPYQYLTLNPEGTMRTFPAYEFR